MGENTVPVLYRHPETGFIEPATVAYSGPIPKKVWVNLNRQFLKLDAGQYFYPSDGMDAYQEAVNQTATTAERLNRGEIVLTQATPVTYLTGVAYKALYRYHMREVQPKRKIYRAVEEKTVGRGAVGEDGFDIDNYDGTEDNPDKTMTDACNERCIESIPVGSALTAQQLVESLPGVPYMCERREKALDLLGEICENLLKADRGNRIIIDAFAAYIVAKGNLLVAASLLRMGKSCFYENWPKWLRTARAAAERN